MDVLPKTRLWKWLGMAGLLLCAPLAWAQAGGRVAQVDAIRTSAHDQFVEQLAALHRDADHLSVDDKRYVLFLDGWEANYEGHYPEAENIFRQVMAGGGDDALGIRAMALLMNNLGNQGNYAEAYAMATRAGDDLPNVPDGEARYVLLANLSQMLTFAGQPDVGLKYADMMLAATPPGYSPCQAMVQKVTALEGARKLTSRSPVLLSTVDSCNADHQPVFANTMSLILVDRLLAENKQPEALAALDRIAPAIQATQYFPHMVDVASARARAYEQLGNSDEAKKAALQVVAMSHPGDVNEALRYAYHILYGIEKADGNTAKALDYYERYVVQDQGYLRDSNVRNAAYEAARKHFLDERLQAEGLSKENNILRLQQALDAKAVETSRLYVVVMLLALLTIGLWTVRIKRSQLRFKWLSSRDGLTGIAHHQHFMAETGRTMKALEKRAADGCLVFLDLDHFKQVNDTHGHAIGDAVLKHTVAVCKGQLRTSDLFGRLGGEEFAMWLMDTPRLQGSVVAERIRAALAASPLVIDDLVVPFSASIGVACTDTLGYDLPALCRAADAALYRAKRMGRNRVVFDDGEPSGALSVLATRAASPGN
jgi:diguanylate cyclase (GGDEF)-like protein